MRAPLHTDIVLCIIKYGSIYLIVGIAMKNYGLRNFRTFKNNLIIGFSRKNLPGCISTAVIRLYLC